MVELNSKRKLGGFIKNWCRDQRQHLTFIFKKCNGNLQERSKGGLFQLVVKHLVLPPPVDATKDPEIREADKFQLQAFSTHEIRRTLKSFSSNKDEKDFIYGYICQRHLTG